MSLPRAFWAVANGHGELREERLPPAPPPGFLRVRALASGVSRGTEAIVFAGRVPDSQFVTMRAPLMAGDFPFPVKYGYAVVGRVAGRPGRCFVLHPHQNCFDAPAVTCIAVPDAVPTRRAVLAANMETALNIVWDAAPLAGERIMVIGAGVVGLLVASLLARIPACAVTLVDIESARAPLAAAFGCAFTTPSDAPGEQELIVHASASEAGLRLALGCAADEARIVEASWFADRAPALPLGESFHARRLRLISSQVGRIAGPMRGRRDHAQRLGIALSLLCDDLYDRLLEAPVAFADLPREMPRLLSGGLCHVVVYPDEEGDAACTA